MRHADGRGMQHRGDTGQERHGEGKAVDLDVPRIVARPGRNGNLAVRESDRDGEGKYGSQMGRDLVSRSAASAWAVVFLLESQVLSSCSAL